MNIIPPTMSRSQPNAPLPVVVLPDDLVLEILSLLAVKPLTRLRSVSKSWNAIISNPTFVKMHLKISSQNPHLIQPWYLPTAIGVTSFVPFPVRRLFENPHQSTTLVGDPHYRWDDVIKDYEIVGSCNGLICLVGYSFAEPSYEKMWLRFWNPATRTMSKQLGSFRHSLEHSREYFYGPCRFAFGYDNSMEIYKVVAFHVDSYKDQDVWRHRCTVNVFSLGGDNDNNWRYIPSFPVVPFRSRLFKKHNEGVYLTGTINWLAFCNNFSYNYNFYFSDLNLEDITAEKLVIVSLDLSSETYTELLLPQGFSDFSEMPRVEPVIGVLTDCLCFSHDFKGTHLVIWQMKEFGVPDSWTQLLKVSYVHDLQTSPVQFYYPWLPLCLSKNGDTLLLANDKQKDAIFLYNWRHNTVERTRLTNPMWWSCAKDYVESLVSVF